jgi:hypothetical protein
VELQRAESGALSAQTIHDSYHVHGQLSVTLHLLDGADRERQQARGDGV